MNFSDYAAGATRTINKDLTPKEALGNAALGVAGEAGELADAVKKVLYHGHQLDIQKLIDESGDVLFYLNWLLVGIGSSLEEAARHNYNKLSQRYPNGFNSEASINRKI